MNKKLTDLLAKLEGIERDGDFVAMSEKLAMSLRGGYDGANSTCNSGCSSNAGCAGNTQCSNNSGCTGNSNCHGQDGSC